MLMIGFGHAISPGSAGTIAEGMPNKLSEEIVSYPLIEQVHAATAIGSIRPGSHRTGSGSIVLRPEAQSSRPYGEVVRSRRSALDFVGGSRTISFEQFSTLLDVATRDADLVQLYAYVHRVEGLDPGVYRHWPSSGTLELLKSGDQRVMAAALSLSQELAGNSCVTFSMIADLKRGYRQAHIEAGRIGHRLYLASEAMGFGSTGIGAFFDDRVHTYLDLSPEEGQVVYHFACGYPVPDPRLAE
jgi:SagB-type dehydrogenase family enzyme